MPSVPNRPTLPLIPPAPSYKPFPLEDLPNELLERVFLWIRIFSKKDLVNAVRVSKQWWKYFAPLIYEVHPMYFTIAKHNHRSVFAGLGVEFLTPRVLEIRSRQHVWSYFGPNRKFDLLNGITRLGLLDEVASISFVEAILVQPGLFSNITHLLLGWPMFYDLVHYGIGNYGRPSTGRAFIGETLIKYLRPKFLTISYHLIDYNLPFDPVLLARVTAILMLSWEPEIMYHVQAGPNNMPPILGARRTIIQGLPCRTEMGQCFHRTMIQNHLRQIYSAIEVEELPFTIAAVADACDANDIDIDMLPGLKEVYIDYYNVPCLSYSNVVAFIDETFADHEATLDPDDETRYFPVLDHVRFFPLTTRWWFEDSEPEGRFYS